jgi:hypothetical protein
MVIAAKKAKALVRRTIATSLKKGKYMTNYQTQKRNTLRNGNE